MMIPSLILSLSPVCSWHASSAHEVIPILRTDGHTENLGSRLWALTGFSIHFDCKPHGKIDAGIQLVCATNITAKRVFRVLLCKS